MVVTFELAKPPGVRSCFDDRGPGAGGEWAMARPRLANGRFGSEVHRVYEQISRYRLASLKQELRDLMEAAEAGELEYGPQGDVERMQFGRRWVLELRHRCRSGSVVDNVRFYFTEPALDPDVLLGLHFTLKMRSDGAQDWRVAQNRDCQEAEERIRDHYGLNQRSHDLDI